MSSLNMPVIRALVAKDWDLFQKQLAAYLLGAVGALTLLGMATPWTFYLGSTILIVLLVASTCFAVSQALVVERKESTLAFVMSLPVSPRDFTVAKILSNLLTFGVPFVLMALGTVAVILSTPLPDGLLILAAPLFAHVLLANSVSMAAAMSIESEGWNIFVMVSMSVLINPLIMLLGQIDEIAKPARTNEVVWSSPLLLMLALQISLSAIVLIWTAWRHGRKAAFY
jgi:ABC-type transport system involved in multi-copper enzyme maturation permease subunit